MLRLANSVLSSANAACYDRWTVTSLSAALTRQPASGGGINATRITMAYVAPSHGGDADAC